MINDGKTRYADDITLQELVRLRVENERLREDKEMWADATAKAQQEIERLREALKKIANGYSDEDGMKNIARAALKGDE